MPKDTKTLGNSKARACESLGFVHKKGCARDLTQPLSFLCLIADLAQPFYISIHNINMHSLRFFGKSRHT